MKTSVRLIAFALPLLAVLEVPQTQAETRLFTIGRGGIPWRDVGERIVGLEDNTASGTLQPRELLPEQDILVGPLTERGELTNIFGRKWSLTKVGRGEEFELGVTPRFWSAVVTSIVAGGPRRLIDGDPNTVTRVIHVTKGGVGRDQLYTFDLGFPVPVNRVVFFPPDRGVDEEGGLIKQRFPRAYEVSGALEARDYLLLSEEDRYHTLDRLLARTFFNADRVVDLRFPTEILRFLRISFNLVDQVYLLGEIQVFGEGFPPVTSYRTAVISLDKPVNFGRIWWKLEKFRKTAVDPEPIPAPNAPVDFVLETRTGKDDSPKVFHLVSEFRGEEEVDEDTFSRAPESSIRQGSRPGDKATIADDLENWSTWSTPYRHSGEAIRSPDARRFLQVQFKMESKDVFTFGQVESVAIEFSPLLVEEIVGEVGLAGALEGEEPLSVPAGVDTTFVYDLRAEFGANGRLGFDAIRVQTIAESEFVRLEIGEPLVEVVPDSLRSERGVLTVFFPSHRIERFSGRERLRLHFRTTLLSFSTFFSAEVFELEGQNLPQSVDAGDASAQLSSDDIRVFASVASLDVLSTFELFPRVLTPNGDGVNDALEIRLTLLGVDHTDTEMGVYTLAGQQVKSLVADERGQGVYGETWDGRDDSGALATPGVYLLRVRIDTDRGDFERIRPFAVVY